MTEDTRALLQQMQAQAAPSPSNTNPVQLVREEYRQKIPLAGAVEEVKAIEDHTVSSVTPEIPLRLYRPQVEEDVDFLPALVYFHGGGYVSGSFDTHDRPLRSLANASGCVVVAVEYRLAPEYPFPAALEECFAAVQWVIQEAGELRINASKVAEEPLTRIEALLPWCTQMASSICHSATEILARETPLGKTSLLQVLNEAAT